MKLPVIKHLAKFIEENDQDFVEEAIIVLEALIEAPNLSEAEIDVIGELLSNMYGSLEVSRSISSGMSTTDALNGFMKRVLGSIDR